MVAFDIVCPLFVSHSEITCVSIKKFSYGHSSVISVVTLVHYGGTHSIEPIMGNYTIMRNNHQGLNAIHTNFRFKRKEVVLHMYISQDIARSTGPNLCLCRCVSAI